MPRVVSAVPAPAVRVARARSTSTTRLPRPRRLRAALQHPHDVRALGRDLRKPTAPRLRLAAPYPLRSQLGCDLRVRNPGSRGDLVSAAMYRVDDVQAILDVGDRGVIRQLVDELLQDLLRRWVRHVSSMPWPSGRGGIDRLRPRHPTSTASRAFPRRRRGERDRPPAPRGARRARSTWSVPHGPRWAPRCCSGPASGGWCGR